MAAGNDLNALYGEVLGVARSLMRSDMASIQAYSPERQQLYMLAHQGFAPESAEFWEWVRADTGSSCGRALAVNERILVPDMDLFEGHPEDVGAYRRSGILSVQSTPLRAHSGQIVGMLSTHWRERRELDKADFRLFDVLARIAADLIERTVANVALRESEATINKLLTLMPVAVYACDTEGRLTFFNRRAVECWGREPKIGDLDDRWCGSLRMWLPDGSFLKHDDCPMADAARRGLTFRNTKVVIEQPSGNRIVASVNIDPLYNADGELIGAINVFEDITQHKRAEQALRDSEERFRTLADNMDQLAWTCDKLGDVTWYNQRWLDYTGRTFEEMRDWGWKLVQRPDHVESVVAGVTRSRESGEPWEDTFPLRGRDGEYRWFLSRAVPIKNADGVVVRWFGTNTDITERQQADEMQRLLASELSHRVKNMLATVQAIATQTLRHKRDPAEFVSSFSGRIQSMSRVHSLLSNTEWQGADLRDVIRDQVHFGPTDETRVALRGPAVQLESQAVPQVAMMLHELGTNSIKYGALSRPEGRVTINWLVSAATVCLRWIERGGPPVTAPAKRGFGSTLIERSAKSLSGNALLTIEAEGVSWEITFPLPRPSAAIAGIGLVNKKGLIATPPARPAPHLLQLPCLPANGFWSLKTKHSWRLM